MKIWIDAKNPALHSGGISAWLKDLLASLEPEVFNRIVLVSPRIKGLSIYPDLNVNRLELPWISWLPRKIAQVLYENLVFRLFAKFEKPDVIFSPYFDIAIPKGIPTFITIHDFCFLDVPDVYTTMQKKYYIHMMKQAVRRAEGIITVSNTTREQLISRLNTPPTSVHVVTNKVDNSFLKFVPSAEDIEIFNKGYDIDSIKILYTSGFEKRKNILNLLKGFRILLSENRNFSLLVTGKDKARWLELISSDNLLMSRTVFLGHLTESELKTAYIACDVVVYPSLSEGFGRACIEAMSVGTPLACSNLGVFHEVAGEYPKYFDPLKPADIARTIAIAAQSGKKIPVERYTQKHESDVFDFSNLLLSYL